MNGEARLWFQNGDHEDLLDSTDTGILRKAEDILEASHDGFFVTDGTGKIILINCASTRSCRVTKEYYIGKYAQVLVDQGLYKEIVVLVAINARKTFTFRFEMTGGKEIGPKIMATATPICDSVGNIRTVVTNIRDIAEILHLKSVLTQQLHK